MSVADVVVVGGGPVGLLLASELALHRVDVTVVERLEAIVDQPKAGTLHARAVQQLRRRGYLHAGPLDGGPEALARTAFHFAAQASLPITSPAAEGPPVVNQWQAELERFLEAVCLARGVRILRGHAVEAVEQDDAGTHVAVTGPGGPGTIHASWVVGADGGRGVVRRAAGIGVTDAPATLRCLLGRVHLTQPGRAPAGWQETPRGWTLLNLDPAGLSRLITFEFGVLHADRAAPVTADELGATAERITGRPLPFDQVAWSGRFSDFSRLADTYRAGRLLLAGDAAHLHFPVGGQGLNLGIQDAFNLGWKLAMVVKGGAGEALLDTYTQERRPHAERVIAYTRDQARAMDPRPEQWSERARLLAEVGDPRRREALGAAVSSQDVTTGREPGDAPVVGTFLADRRIRTGDVTTRLSALLAGGRGLLLARASGDGPGASAAEAVAVAQRWRGRVDVAVDDGPEQPPVAAFLAEPGRSAAGEAALDAASAAILVRADGYVAWTSDGPCGATLEGALRRWFGAPTGRSVPTARPPLAERGDPVLTAHP